MPRPVPRQSNWGTELALPSDGWVLVTGAGKVHGGATVGWYEVVTPADGC